MSLLGTAVYANPATPLWLGVDGGTISGNLIVDGGIQSLTNVSAPSFLVLDPSGNTTGVMTRSDPGAGAGLAFQGGAFKFGRIGTGSANTILTTSVAGANTDLLSVGGTMNCLIGPTPTQIITSAKPIISIPESPAAPYGFPVDNTVTGVAGAEYDVQVTGIVGVASGTPTAGDSVVFDFTAGTGASIGATVFPAETGAAVGNYGVNGAGPLTTSTGVGINMRFRCSPTASGTILGANVRTFLAGGSTAIYQASLTLLDVQRVR